MSVVKGSLPVLVPWGTGQRFSCHSCTRCCRDLLVELREDDRLRIDEGGWSERLDIPPYIRWGDKWVLNKRSDGACVFLSEDGKCRIHSDQGFDAKPLPCRLFPYTLHPSMNRTMVGWRFDCPTVARSAGQPVQEAAMAISRLASELAVDKHPQAPTLYLKPKLPIQAEELNHLERALDAWLSQTGTSCSLRLQGAVWLTQFLQEAKLEAVRGDRFVELVTVFTGVLADELWNPPANLRRRQLSMFRQWVFAHGEHLKFADLQAGRWARLGQRWRQLRWSGRFRRGRGPVPYRSANLPLATPPPKVSFEDVERVANADEEAGAIDECITRYVRGRLLSRSYFGPVYYGWSMLEGLTALWLSVAAVGWWSRFLAARSGCATLKSSHVLDALGIVDAASGRSPALGTGAERLRISYLSRDQGVAALLKHYSPIPPDARSATRHEP